MDQEISNNNNETTIETIKYLKQAIDILSEDHDWKAICAEMAKRNPKEFCTLVRGLKDWELETLKIYKDNKKGSAGMLAAIEYVRSLSRCSIDEARSIIASLIDKNVY